MKRYVAISLSTFLLCYSQNINAMAFFQKLFGTPTTQSGAAQSPQQQEFIIRTDGAPITVGQFSIPITNNLVQENRPQTTNILNAQQSTNVETTVFNTMTQTISKGVHDKARSLDFFLGKHKDRIFFYSLVGAYIMLYIRLMRDNRFLKQTDLWASWKCAIPFEELCALPQQELAKDLLRDIQHKYINHIEPTNFITPLVSFLQETHQEHNRIQRYVTIATWISRLRITMLFPVNANTIALAQERKARLAFVKHIFLTWATEHNVQQVNLLIKRSTLRSAGWYLARKTACALCACTIRNLAKIWPISMVLSDISTVYQYLFYYAKVTKNSTRNNVF